MIADARSLRDGTVLEADVAIAGAGAAGITLALELARAGARVLLLESGGHDPEPATQDLYDGVNQGTILNAESSYLTVSRLRYLGGATNHWNGWCRPLDPQDFEPRDWIPQSGWPISRADLEPHYRRALEYVFVAPFDYNVSARKGGLPILPRDSPVHTSFFHLSPPRRFGRDFRPDLEKTPGLRVLLHANLVEIDLDPAGERVASFGLACLGGPRLTARARHHVLALGGIENPRLLLASRRRQGAGVGNGHDLVGRCFMDHPHARLAGDVVLPARGAAMGYYRGQRDRSLNHRIIAALVVDPAAQRERRLANAVVTLTGTPAGAVPHGAAAGSLAAAVDPPAPRLGATYYGFLSISAEAAPDPASRVSLDEAHDALGMPRARIDWRFGAEDMASLRRTLLLVAAELGRSGRGRARVLRDAGKPFAALTWSHHHMGTTRMHADPRHGVVDADCRVHGIANLFVAGSSVFPTSGCSNPTLTIVALAARLASHIRGRLEGA